MVSLANNHAGDYGTESMLAHLAHVAASGLTHAGLGRNLELARAPGMLESALGRVALISCTSSFPGGTRAGMDRADVRGRPGVNPLRFETVELLDDEGMTAARLLQSKIAGKAVPVPAEEIVIGGKKFRRGIAPRTVTEPDSGDLAALLASIRSVRERADWVVVAMHAHKSEQGDRSRPAEFIQICARAAIGAGADIVFGHGPHVLWGIELHEGRPIFYSLGNFVVQYEGIDRFPAEAYERSGLGPGASPTDLRRRWREVGDGRQTIGCGKAYWPCPFS